MENNMRLLYYGGKFGDNIDITFGLLPEKKFEKFVDMCFGSGNVTRNISCEMQNIQRIGIEKDSTVYAVHSCIKDQPLHLIAELRRLENNQDTFDRMKKVVDDCIKGEKINQLEVATATLYTICFSYNSMRDRRRHRKYAHLEIDNELRRKEEACFRAQKSIFYTKLPMVIMDLHEAWQGVQILNDDLFNNLYMFEEHCVCYVDLPYEFSKRGIPKGEKRKSAGYLVEMGQEMHEILIDKLIELKKASKLNASVMLCTNYEVDEDMNLIIPNDDLYTILLHYGFRMVVVEVKESSEVIRKQTTDEEELKKQKKRKAEVIFINYEDICGSWDDYEFYDEKDVFGH